MRSHGKKYTAAREQVENRSYALADALPLIQKIKFAKFDETVALSIRLGVDPKHADQMVRGTVVLPNGLGKSKRVLVIASGDKQREAMEAGADAILLDNMSAGEVRACFIEAAGRVRLEVSGGVNLENIRAYAETGVDCISVGALTHSAPAADINFLIKPL